MNPIARQRLVGFAGYARAGKDEATAALVADGYTRTYYGDAIKAHFDPMLQECLGISAFTELDEEKERIRPILEHGGEVLLPYLMPKYGEFLERLLERGPVVNPRVMSEGRLWRRLGGSIVWISRPGVGAKSQWERDYFARMRADGLISGHIVNDGTAAQLHEAVRFATTLHPRHDFTLSASCLEPHAA